MYKLPKYYCGNINSSLFEKEVDVVGEDGKEKKVTVTSCRMRVAEGTSFEKMDKVVEVSFWNKSKEDLRLEYGDALVFVGSDIKEVEYTDKEGKIQNVSQLNCHKITSYMDKDKYLTITTEDNVVGIIAKEPQVETVDTSVGTRNLVKFPVSILVNKEANESKLTLVSLWRESVPFKKGDQVKLYGSYYFFTEEKDGKEESIQLFNAKDYKILKTKEQIQENKQKKKQADKEVQGMENQL